MAHKKHCVSTQRWPESSSGVLIHFVTQPRFRPMTVVALHRILASGRWPISVDGAPEGHLCDWCCKPAVHQLTAIGGIYHSCPVCSSASFCNTTSG